LLSNQKQKKALLPSKVQQGSGLNSRDEGIQSNLYLGVVLTNDFI
jgi:hypothetical protein